jgi:hypothetical protein
MRDSLGAEQASNPRPWNGAPEFEALWALALALALALGACVVEVAATGPA